MSVQAKPLVTTVKLKECGGFEVSHRFCQKWQAAVFALPFSAQFN